MSERRLVQLRVGTLAKIGFVAGALASGAVMVAAQDLSRAPGGQRLTGLFTQTFAGDTNFALEDPSPGSSLRTTSTLGLTYLTETPREQLSFGADVSLFTRVGGADDGEDNTEIIATLPSVTARYTRAGARGGFDIGGSFDAQPLTFLSEVEGGGTRLTTAGDVALSFGAEGARAVLTLGLDGSVLDYVDTDDPDLVDNRSVGASAGLDLKLAPVLDAGLDLRASIFDADDADETERRRLRFGASLAYAANARTDLRLGSGIAFEEEDTTAGTEDGVLYDGSVGIGILLPRGEFGADLGFATTIDGDVTTTAGLDLTREFAGGGSLTGSLDRSLTIADDGGDQAVTAASLSLGVPLNALTNANFGASYALTEELDTVDPDETRVTLSAGITRQLSARLSLTAGYAYSLRDEGDERADNHGVSVSLAVPLDF